MKSIQTKGFILKKTPLLNKDILFTIFTDTDGKISSIAKGIKKITSRRAPHIQTGNLVEVELQSRGDILYLQNSKLISAFSQIRENSKKTSFLYVYFFVLDRMLPEHQSEPEIFHAAYTFVVSMAKDENFAGKEFTQHFNKLMSAAGYTKEEKPLLELMKIAEEVINEKLPVEGI
jgi:DNA repair protein RecO